MPICCVILSNIELQKNKNKQKKNLHDLNHSDWNPKVLRSDTTVRDH